MTLTLEDTPERRDLNQPDHFVRIDSLCLIYGFKDTITSQLNGMVAYVIARAVAGPEGYYGVNDTHFECALRGMPTVYVISHRNLLHLDDSDTLIIELMSKE